MDQHAGAHDAITTHAMRDRDQWHRFRLRARRAAGLHAMRCMVHHADAVIDATVDDSLDQNVTLAHARLQ